MSLWRREASERLPELQRIIASREIDNPMRLWIELTPAFHDLCEKDPIPLDLIKRFWGYAKWCMTQKNEDVATAVALAFSEHLLDRKATRQILPEIMTRQEYQGMRELLLYHKSEEDYANGLKLFDTPKKR